MELALTLGVLIGTVLGLTGSGGGILAVPALTFGLGWTMQQAAPVALIAVALSAALGAAQAFPKRLVRYRAACLMVLTGLPFTSVGIGVAKLLPQRYLLGLFAMAMLWVALRFFRSARSTSIASYESDRVWARIDAKTGRFSWSATTVILFAALGALIGFITGLLGVGGGFIIVPLLRRFTNVSMQGIVATSLMVIALVGSGSVVSALAHGAQLPMPATALFACATALGMFIGRGLATRTSEKTVQFGFALLVAAVALGLMLKAVAQT